MNKARVGSTLDSMFEELGELEDVEILTQKKSWPASSSWCAELRRSPSRSWLGGCERAGWPCTRWATSDQADGHHRLRFAGCGSARCKVGDEGCRQACGFQTHAQRPQSLGPVISGSGPGVIHDIRLSYGGRGLMPGPSSHFPSAVRAMRAPGHVWQARRVPCCQGQNYDRLFDKRAAARQLRAYRRKGPGGATRRLLQAVQARAEREASVLDIGGGVGVLQHELARAGAERVTSVDASTAYLQAARSEAERLGYLPRWQWVGG